MPQKSAFLQLSATLVVTLVLKTPYQTDAPLAHQQLLPSVMEIHLQQALQELVQ